MSSIKYREIPETFEAIAVGEIVNQAPTAWPDWVQQAILDEDLAFSTDGDLYFYSQEWTVKAEQGQYLLRNQFGHLKLVDGPEFMQRYEVVR